MAPEDLTAASRTAASSSRSAQTCRRTLNAHGVWAVIVILAGTCLTCVKGENFNYATAGAQLALAYRNDMQGCVTGLNKLCPYLDPAAITASSSVYDAQNATVTATATNPVGFCQPNCVRARSNYDACWVAFYSKYFSSVDVGGATLSADGSTWTQLNGQNLTTFCAPYTSGAPARGAVSLLVLLGSAAALVFSLL